MFPEIAEQVRRCSPFDHIAIATVSQDSPSLTPLSTYGTIFLQEEELKALPTSGIPFPPLHENRTPYIIEDLTQRVSNPLEALLVQRGVRSLLAAPLIAEGEVIGLLALASRWLNLYKESDVEFVQRVAAQLAGGMFRVRPFEAEGHCPKEMATLDSIADVPPQREELRVIDQLRQELLATVSHELRTPLTSIKGYAATLLQQDVQWDSASRHNFLLIIDQEADRLDRYVNDLLTMSQLEAGVLKLNRGLHSPQDIFDVIADELAVLAQRHHLLLVVPPNLPRLLVDRERLGQVITNLVTNAAKFSPEGTPITVEARRTPEGLILSIADQGIGVTSDELERIFDRFYQSPRGTSHKRTGTGLGLSISRRLIEAHGGRIWCQSRVGQGATFFFTLPTAPKRGRRNVQDFGDG